MSLRVSTLVWQSSRASGSDLVMLLAIADFANDDGTAYPSVATLACKARMSPRNARYVLDRLVASGELAIKVNSGPKGCNVYRITIKPPLQAPAPLKTTAPLQPASPTPAAGFPLPLQAPAPEPSLNRQETSVMSGKPDLAAQCREILAYLNDRAGTSFRFVSANLELIKARLKSGASPDDCRRIVDAKVNDWFGDAGQRKYLRPATLFRASNFEQYLGALGASDTANNVPEWIRRGYGSAIEMQQAQEAA